jgi:hypothetical protein
MGGRYLVTGVQLSMIKILSETRDIETVEKLCQEIYDNQYVADSEEDIKKDAEILKNYLNIGVEM